MFIVGGVEGQTAILRFLLSGTPISDDVRDKLTELSMPETTPSAVVGSVEAVELIYARKDDLPPELLSLGADLAEMATRHDFHGYRSSGRGAGISEVLRSIKDVQAPPAPQSAEPPEPKADYVAAPVTRNVQPGVSLPAPPAP